MTAFVISKDHNNHFKFTYASRKGKTIFTSIPCKNKLDCERILEGLRNNPTSFTFTKKKAGSGKYFFRISISGLVLATSRKFSTERLVEKGIDGILRNAPIAETLDFSETEDLFARPTSEVNQP